VPQGRRHPRRGGGLVHVAVDESGEPTRVPDGFREAVVEFRASPPDPV